MSHYFENDSNIKSKTKKIDVKINDINYYYYTDNGVFSKRELDYGTSLLLKCFEVNNELNNNILDLGCGCGPIGLYFSKLGFNVDMVDINKRALELTKKSFQEQNLIANIFESNCYDSITKKYDYIISNPPIKAGKKMLYEFVTKASLFLKKNGELWIVVRKDKGAQSLIKDMHSYYQTINVIFKKKGYYIIKLK